jgi:hypothetical protein
MHTFTFAGMDERQIREMVRHECGHVAVGRALGFPAGGIVLDKESAGADSDHHLSFPEMKDAIAYIERRLQVLYAGSIAQSLDSAGKCQPARCRGFLETTAANDMAKIRELSRVLVGMTDPGLDDASYSQKLSLNDDRFSTEALKIVEANATLIWEMVDAFLLALKDNIKAAGIVSKAPIRSYRFTSEKIDAVLKNRPIVLP